MVGRNQHENQCRLERTNHIMQHARYKTFVVNVSQNCMLPVLVSQRDNHPHVVLLIRWSLAHICGGMSSVLEPNRWNAGLFTTEAAVLIATPSTVSQSNRLHSNNEPDWKTRSIILDMDRSKEMDGSCDCGSANERSEAEPRARLAEMQLCQGLTTTLHEFAQEQERSTRAN
jgi:hypothetical protein